MYRILVSKDLDNIPIEDKGLYGHAKNVFDLLPMPKMLVELKRESTKKTKLKYIANKLVNRRYDNWLDPEFYPNYLIQGDTLCLDNALSLYNVKNVDGNNYLWTDACIYSLIDFYPFFSLISEKTKRNIYRMEGRVLHTCKHIFVTSEWSKRMMMYHYNILPDKITVVKRGHTPYSFNYNKLDDHIFKIVFVSTDWDRKGGKKALEIFRKIRTLDVQLHIVGDHPHIDMEGTVLHGWRGETYVDELINSCHVLIHPTKADVVGRVISQASSKGVPTIGSRIAGIPEYVTRTADSVYDYVNYIEQLATESGFYESENNKVKQSYTTLQQSINQVLGVINDQQ